MENIVRPLDGGTQAEMLHRTCDGDRRHQRTLWRVLRQKRRTQENTHPNPLAGRGEEGTFHAAASRPLTVGNNDRTILCALMRQLLQHQIRRVHSIITDDLFPDEYRSQILRDLRLDQPIRSRAQDVSAARCACNIVARLTQCRDLLPHRRPRHTEPLRDLLARNTAPCLTQQLQHIAPHHRTSKQKVICSIIQQITLPRYKNIERYIRSLHPLRPNKPLKGIEILCIHRDRLE